MANRNRANIDAKTASAARKKNPQLVKFGFSYLISSLVCKALELPPPKTPNQVKAEKATSREAKKKREKLQSKGQFTLMNIEIPGTNLIATTKVRKQ